MYFIYIYDSRNKNNGFLESIRQYAEEHSFYVKEIECTDGIPKNRIFFKALENLKLESYRAPIIIDAISAKYHYDLLMSSNKCIVLLPHEMDRTADLSEVNPFTEEQAINCGAMYMYLNIDYSEERNRVLMPVVQFNKAVNYEAFENLLIEFVVEHIYYPSIFLTREQHHECCGRYILLLNKILNGYVPEHLVPKRKAGFPKDCQTIDIMIANTAIKANGKDIPLQIKC